MKTKTILLSLLSLVLLSCREDYSDYDPEAMARAKESVDMCYNIFTDWEKTDSSYTKSYMISEQGDSTSVVCYELRLKKDSDTLLITAPGDSATEWFAGIFGEKDVISQICHSRIDIHDDYYNDKKFGLFQCPKSSPLVPPSSDPSIQAGINYLHSNGIRTEKLTYCKTTYSIDVDAIQVSDLKNKESVISTYKLIKDSNLAFGYEKKPDEQHKWIKVHQYAYLDNEMFKVPSRAYTYALIYENGTIEDFNRYISVNVRKENELESIIKNKYFEECTALGMECEIDTVVF